MTSANDPDRARAVLDFWFGAAGEPGDGTVRSEWFAAQPEFDARIAASFGETIEAALAGECDAWGRSAQTACALVIVVDQFTRNVFRGTPRMFAGDRLALDTARRIVAERWDERYDALHRWFCYMPFEHSESIDDQRESLRLFGALRDHPLAGGAWRWAKSHHDVIERFGRFPHRNEILGRASTPDEIAFLREPGSRF